jgi:hypothetical protein
MFETLEKPMRSASGRKCPMDGTSPVATDTPLPTTPSTFRPRKGAKAHGIGDDALPLQLLKMFERSTPSKSPAAETPRELKDQPPPPPPAPLPAVLDQFDRQLPHSSQQRFTFQRPAVGWPAQPESPSAQYAKAIEANRSQISENIKRLLEDYAKKFSSSPSPPVGSPQPVPGEDTLCRIVKSYSGALGASPAPAAARTTVGTPSGPLDREVSGLVGPIAKPAHRDPAKGLHDIPKPKADTAMPLSEEMLRSAAMGQRASSKKVLLSSKSSFSATSSKVGPPSPGMTTPKKQ